jgi:hypothetical protein
LALRNWTLSVLRLLLLRQFVERFVLNIGRLGASVVLLPIVVGDIRYAGQVGVGFTLRLRRGHEESVAVGRRVSRQGEGLLGLGGRG